MRPMTAKKKLHFVHNVTDKMWQTAGLEVEDMCSLIATKILGAKVLLQKATILEKQEYSTRYMQARRARSTKTLPK